MVSLNNFLYNSPKTAEEGAAATRIQDWVDTYSSSLSTLANDITRDSIIHGWDATKATGAFYEGLDSIGGKDATFLNSVLDLSEFLPALFGEQETDVDDKDDYTKFLETKQDELATAELAKVGVEAKSWREPISSRIDKQDELASSALKVDSIKKELSDSDFAKRARPQIKDASREKKLINTYSSMTDAFERADTRVKKLTDSNVLVTAARRRKIISEEVGEVDDKDTIVKVRSKAKSGDYKHTK